jgi:hypothetical protein
MQSLQMSIHILFPICVCNDLDRSTHFEYTCSRLGFDTILKNTTLFNTIDLEKAHLCDPNYCSPMKKFLSPSSTMLISEPKETPQNNTCISTFCHVESVTSKITTTTFCFRSKQLPAHSCMISLTKEITLNYSETFSKNSTPSIRHLCLDTSKFR